MKTGEPLARESSLGESVLWPSCHPFLLYFPSPTGCRSLSPMLLDQFVYLAMTDVYGLKGRLRSLANLRLDSKQRPITFLLKPAIAKTSNVPLVESEV